MNLKMGMQEVEENTNREICWQTLSIRWDVLQAAKSGRGGWGWGLRGHGQAFKEAS